MSRAAGAIRVVRSRVKKIRAPQRQALTFTPAAITKLQVQIFMSCVTTDLSLSGFSGAPIHVLAPIVAIDNIL